MRVFKKPSKFQDASSIETSCLVGLQETQAQGAFGMDGTADASAASGMMGMTGYNPGQGASFVSSGTKASGELLHPSRPYKKPHILCTAAANVQREQLIRLHRIPPWDHKESIG